MRVHLTGTAGDYDSNPKIFTNRGPAGAECLGVVIRDNLERGALYRIAATGRYVMVNAGVTSSLDQRAVRAALEEAR